METPLKRPPRMTIPCPSSATARPPAPSDAIAEMDLKLRGPGEFFGTRQSGAPALRIASIIRDRDILEAARREAVDFVSKPASEEELRRAVAYIRDHWQRRYGLAQVG